MTSQDWLWEHGWRILVDIGGYSEKAARTLTGKFIKENGAEVVERGLRKVAEVKPVEPMSWLQAGFVKIRQANEWKQHSGRVEGSKLPEFDRSRRVKPERLRELIDYLESQPDLNDKKDSIEDSIG